MSTMISVENVSKRYRLGVINRDMLYKDIQSWWARVRSQPDPNAPISELHSRRIEKGDEFWALRNVTLQVEQGEVLGVIGRNGAGKSTLLKLFSQITSPTEGRIRIRGKIASLLEVGTGFHPELTGRENVFLNGAILGMSRSEVRRKFDEIVDFADLKDFIDTPTKRYSSGMYVRLGFAVAAHLDPDILVVDEVLSVGDASFRERCLGKMRDVAGSGRTVLFVSHDLASVHSLCTKTLLLEGGNAICLGDTGEIIKRYLRSSCPQTGRATLDAKNSDAYIEEVSTQQNSGDYASIFTVNEAIFVKITLKVQKYLDNCEICFRVSDELDRLVFHASCNSGSATMRNFEKGRFEASFNIPAAFLSPGNYSIMCNIQQRNTRLVDYNKDVLRFEISQVGLPQHLTAHYAGGIGPILFMQPWSIKCI